MLKKETPPYRLAVGDVLSLPFADSSFDLVIGSPPYCAQRKVKGTTALAHVGEWVDWMVTVTDAALSVSRGPVLWVVAGPGNYTPAPEMLLTKVRESLRCRVLRPLIWTANKPPTNAGTWFSNQWEYILAFTKTYPLPYFNAAEMATPMKYSSGGDFRQRGTDGKRTAGSRYPKHKVRRTIPNVLNVPVGGGLMGWKRATENEACYPEALVDPLIRVLCPSGGIVLDPFCGSGTTVAAAVKSGRIGWGTDIRASQIKLSQQRLKEVLCRLSR